MKSKFKAFTNLDECVASAVEVFAEQQWTWAGIGIPNEHQIRGTLCDLVKHCRGSDRIETGRLAYSDGVFYHQIPNGYDENRSALAELTWINELRMQINELNQRVNERDAEIAELKRELETTNRKAMHGCYDFHCAECDDERLPSADGGE